MGNVFVSMGLSLDGMIAGPNRGPTNPLGDHGVEIHSWAFAQEAFRKNLKLGPGGRPERTTACWTPPSSAPGRT
jgi:hypothetical protein